jgi:hypothetical protein
MKDPLSSTTGLAARMVLIAVVVAAIWLIALWALT